MKLAKDAGLLTTHTLADENDAREELGLSPVTPEDFEAGQAAKAAAVAAFAKAADKTEDEDEDDAAPEGPGDSLPPPVAGASKLSAGGFVPRRPLRPSEQALDLAAMSDFFDGSREKFETGAKPLVAAMIMRALPDVKAAMVDGVIASDEIAALELDVAGLDAFVAEFLETCRAEGYRQVRNELLKGAPSGSVKLASEEEQDDKGYPVDDGPSEAQQDAQDVLSATRKHLVRRMKNRLLSDMEGAAVDVLRTDGDAEEVVARVLDRQVSTGAFKTDAGLVTTKAFSVGRDEMAQEFEGRIESVELSAILDQSTCTECEALDGSEFEFNSAQHDAMTPPLSSRCHGGDSCRCLLVYQIERSRE